MRRRIGGMTLVELLVVIAILGILMGLLFPAIVAARRYALRGRAQTEVKILKDAFIAFELDYERYPSGLVGYDYATNDWNKKGIEDGCTGIQAMSNVVAMFQGANINGMNPGHNRYLAIRASRLRSDGAFADPWGNPYKYMCDYNGDRRVHIWFTGQDGELTLYGEQVAVWSVGRDGSDRKNDHADDVVSW
jgi:prepilin-type N-terminal cleavage/methylation domain-containing protein